MTITLSEIQRLHDECVRTSERFPEAAKSIEEVRRAYNLVYRGKGPSFQSFEEMASMMLYDPTPWTEFAAAVKVWGAMSRDERLGALREEQGRMCSELIESVHHGSDIHGWWSKFDRLALVRAQVKAMEGE